MMKRHVINRLFSVMLYLALCMNGDVYASGQQCADSGGKVARAIVTTAVENREPVNRVLILENKIPEVFFFSDLRHMEGQQITHRWEHEGKVVLRKQFDVSGPRWRIFSRKELKPEMTGQWTIVITDKDDCPLKAVVFQYVEQNPQGQGSAIINLKNQ